MKITNQKKDFDNFVSEVELIYINHKFVTLHMDINSHQSNDLDIHFARGHDKFRNK